MADFTITVSDSILLYGSNPVNLWFSFIWGVDFWGEGSVSISLLGRMVPNPVYVSCGPSNIQLSESRIWDFDFTAPTPNDVYANETVWRKL